jgi:hypothetical protein
MALSHAICYHEIKSSWCVPNAYLTSLSFIRTPYCRLVSNTNSESLSFCNLCTFFLVWFRVPATFTLWRLRQQINVHIVLFNSDNLTEYSSPLKFLLHCHLARSSGVSDATVAALTWCAFNLADCPGWIVLSTPQQIQAIGRGFRLLRCRFKRLEGDFVYSAADSSDWTGISSTPQQIQAIGGGFRLLRSRFKRLEGDLFSAADSSRWRGISSTLQQTQAIGGGCWLFQYCSLC